MMLIDLIRLSTATEAFACHVIHTKLDGGQGEYTVTAERSGGDYFLIHTCLNRSNVWNV